MHDGDTLYFTTGPSGGKSIVKATEKLNDHGVCDSVHASIQSPTGRVEIDLDRKAMTALYYAIGRALAKRRPVPEETAS